LYKTRLFGCAEDKDEVYIGMIHVETKKIFIPQIKTIVGMGGKFYPKKTVVILIQIILIQLVVEIVITNLEVFVENIETGLIKN
jgi:hypothetical protein